MPGALSRLTDIPEQMHADYQRLLNETAQLLILDISPEILSQSVFDILCDPLQLDFYFYFLVSEDKTHLELASSGGDPAIRDGLGSHLEFGEAISGTVAEIKEEVYLQYMQQHNDEMSHVVRGLGVRSYLCEPILAKGRLIGTLSFGSERRDFFLPEELQFLRLVAHQVTLAADRRLQATQLLELERLAVAGRMSAVLAHEINNPLESLTNLLFLLRDQVRSEEGKALISTAESAVALLAQTAQRTLDLCRGKPQQAQTVDLGDLVKEILVSISLPQHVPLRSSINEDLCVRAIPGELRQVIFNLLINAAQFSPVGKDVLLSVQRKGDLAEIRVRDEGAGISEDIRARIFQPFYTTRTIGGTGLGLWVSREMIERAGGTLTFESEPLLRAGTEFIVCLPVVDWGLGQKADPRLS